MRQKFAQKVDYLQIHHDISTATASRDLLLGLQNGLLNSHTTRLFTTALVGLSFLRTNQRYVPQT